jgi:hypothetical protein
LLAGFLRAGRGRLRAIRTARHPNGADRACWTARPR